MFPDKYLGFRLELVIEFTNDDGLWKVRKRAGQFW